VQIPHFIPLVCRKRNGLNESVPAGGHSTVDTQCRRLVTGQVAVVAIEAHGLLRLCHKGLHLHICGSHKRPGYFTKVNTLIPLVDVIGFQAAVRSRDSDKTRLRHQSTLELQR
jgi:hypothetical protein